MKYVAQTVGMLLFGGQVYWMETLWIHTWGFNENMAAAMIGTTLIGTFFLGMFSW